ncbi:hypothetical protein Bealeia1_01436 [Candidatus Bealeia paramacronuclearis]|uniref:Uncharacterized protein n=1 Tax=Candidatus Bealeia paramacronuclearis TaxID=1921001 RepID=A0ABZ2C4F5_9PROT|nr:hypothetical protein [Candidatus Bealeia paramacronuclearis]
MKKNYISTFILAGAIFGFSDAKCIAAKSVVEDTWQPINISIKSTQPKLCGCGSLKSKPTDYFILMVQPTGIGEELSLEKAQADGFVKNIKYTMDEEGYPAGVSFEFDNEKFQDEYQQIGHSISSIVQMVFPGSQSNHACPKAYSVDLVNQDGKWIANPNSTINLQCPTR